MCGGNPLKRMGRSLKRDVLPVAGGIIGGVIGFYAGGPAGAAAGYAAGSAAAGAEKSHQQKKAVKQAIRREARAEKEAKAQESLMLGEARLKRMQGSRSGSLIGGYDSTLTPPAG